MIVLLHGVGGRASMWDAVRRALTSQGVDSLALDLPGYGANTQLLDVYDFTNLSAWLAGRLQPLIAQGHSIILAGQSFGGMIALDYVARSTQDANMAQVSSLVIMNSSPAFGKIGGDFQSKFIAARLAPLKQGKTMREVALGIVPGMLGRRAPASCHDEAVEMMAAVPTATYEAAVPCVASFDRRSNLRSLSLPVLCIAGEDDKTAAPEVMRVMAGHIKGSEYVSVAGAGHLMPIEQADEVAALLVEFNNRVAP